MGAMQPWHWVIVILAFIVLFGAKKLPEMARSIGQSARVFKSEMKGMQADDEARTRAPEQPAALPPSSQPTAQPTAQPRSQSAPQAQAGEGTTDASR